ncbi:spore germination protein, partial [Flavobacterium sp. IR1]
MSWFSIKKRLSLPTENDTQAMTVQEAIEDGMTSSDFEHQIIVTPYKNIWVSYYGTLIDPNKLHDDVIEKIQARQFHTPEDLRT